MEEKKIMIFYRKYLDDQWKFIFVVPVAGFFPSLTFNKYAKNAKNSILDICIRIGWFLSSYRSVWSHKV